MQQASVIWFENINDRLTSLNLDKEKVFAEVTVNGFIDETVLRNTLVEKLGIKEEYLDSEEYTLFVAKLKLKGKV